jgi:hypothetical protein
MRKLNEFLGLPVGDPFGGPAYGKREDPATAMTAFKIIGTAVSVMSTLNQGRQAQQAADYNAQVNAQNAQIAQTNAAAQAKQIDRENYLRLGAIRANQGRSGGEMTGSALDVLGDVAGQGEYEKQLAVYEGDMKARGFRNTAALDTASGENARTSSYFKAGAELMSGGYDYLSERKKLVRA